MDATNLITPLVSVITSIDLDHQKILGNSRAEIAREKAGIIKPGVPVVSIAQTTDVREVIDEVASSADVATQRPNRLRQRSNLDIDHTAGSVKQIPSVERRHFRDPLNFRFELLILHIEKFAFGITDCI